MTPSRNPPLVPKKLSEAWKISFQGEEPPTWGEISGWLEILQGRPSRYEALYESGSATVTIIYSGKQVAGGGLHMANDPRSGESPRWLDERLARIDDKIEMTRKLIEERLNSYGARLDQFLGEMRDRDNQRHMETLAIQRELDRKLESTNKKLDSTTRWIVGIVLAGVFAIIAALIGLLRFPAPPGAGS